MPVVPPFSSSNPGYKRVLRGVGSSVVWVVSVQVGCTVDQPGNVKHTHVSEAAQNEEGSGKVLAPAIVGNDGRKEEAHQNIEKGIGFLLEHDNWVGKHVTHIQFTSSFHNIRMLLDQQPSAVGKEEASGSIVGVGICFAVLVVDSVITDPVEKGTLIGAGVAAHEEESEGKASFKAAMGEQSMRSYNNSKACKVVDDVAPDPCVRHSQGSMDNCTVNSQDVACWDVDAHERVIVALLPMVVQNTRDVHPHFQREIHLDSIVSCSLSS